jgi:hypothetical protein
MQKTFRKLNPIQAVRSPQSVSDANLQETIESMADAGTYPKGLIAYTQKKIETDDYVAIFGFDTQKQEWVLKRTNKSDGSVLNLRGSRQDLADGLAFERALLQREVNEALEHEELTNPDYMTDERLECFKWTTETPHGREYKTIAHQRVWLMLQARLAQLGHLPITVSNLERAYCDLLDMTPCPLDHWFGKRDARLAQEAKERNAELERSVPVAETPFENLGPAPEVEARRQADAANRKLAAGTSGSTAIITPQGLRKLKSLAYTSRFSGEHRK